MTPSEPRPPESGTTTAIRLVLVDDHRLLIDSLVGAIQSHDDLEVVGTAGSIADALVVVERCRPDVVLLDLRLGGDDAVSSIGRLVEAGGGSKVVLLTATHDRRHAARAIEAGASGYLTKQQPLPELLAGIRAVWRGQATVDPSLLGGILEQLSGGDPTRLTARELEVLRMLHAGHAAERIARQLHIAPNTVRNHVQRILTKLGATSRLEAVAIARRDGLLDE
ncbi:MAG: response regulator transcription factor [Acidimicrobiales bacterium]|nr:response regulator transcription factor [Acidimicrobiales bacterium]MCB9393473.1 response regulator transcription factor [Acidimicrobiaceae bacterium]